MLEYQLELTDCTLLTNLSTSIIDFLLQPILKILELLPLKFDLKNLANCVPAMLIFQGPIFWQKNTKSGERIRTSDLQHVSLMCFLYTNEVTYEKELRSNKL